MEISDYLQTTVALHTETNRYFLNREVRGPPSSSSCTFCTFSSRHFVVPPCLLIFLQLTAQLWTLIGLYCMFRSAEIGLWTQKGRSQWPRGIRLMSTAARLLRLWVRIPLETWMSFCYDCCVFSDRGLCDGPIPCPEECYGMWCVCVWPRILKNEEAMAHVGVQHHRKKNNAEREHKPWAPNPTKQKQSTHEHNLRQIRISNDWFTNSFVNQ